MLVDRPQGVRQEAEEGVAAASKIAEVAAPIHTLVKFPMGSSQLSTQDRG